MEHLQRHAPIDGEGFAYICDVVAAGAGAYRGRVIILERRALSECFDPPLVLYTPASFTSEEAARSPTHEFALEALRCATAETLFYLDSLAPCRCVRRG